MPLLEEHVARCLHLKKDGAQSLNSFKNLQNTWKGVQGFIQLISLTTHFGLKAEIFSFLWLKLNTFFIITMDEMIIWRIKHERCHGDSHSVI